MTDQTKLIAALREFLWLAICWNDHNFDVGTVVVKCRKLCRELGINNIEDANDLLATFYHDNHNSDEKGYES